MRKLASVLAVALAVCLSGWFAVCVAADVASSGPALTAQDAWLRVTPGSDVAAAYVTLHNAGSRAITVVSVESPAASMAMIHETKIEGGMARMRSHASLVIAPGQTLKLQPEGLHIMLHGLARPLSPADSVTLVLSLADGTSVQIVARVRPLNGQ